LRIELGDLGPVIAQQLDPQRGRRIQPRAGGDAGQRRAEAFIEQDPID
jgi:hypothetical protein